MDGKRGRARKEGRTERRRKEGRKGRWEETGREEGDSCSSFLLQHTSLPGRLRRREEGGEGRPGDG